MTWKMMRWFVKGWIKYLRWESNWRESISIVVLGSMALQLLGKLWNYQESAWKLGECMDTKWAYLISEEVFLPVNYQIRLFKLLSQLRKMNSSLRSLLSQVDIFLLDVFTFWQEFSEREWRLANLATTSTNLCITVLTVLWWMEWALRIPLTNSIPKLTKANNQVPYSKQRIPPSSAWPAMGWTLSQRASASQLRLRLAIGCALMAWALILMDVEATSTEWQALKG